MIDEDALARSKKIRTDRPLDSYSVDELEQMMEAEYRKGYPWDLKQEPNVDLPFTFEGYLAANAEMVKKMFAMMAEAEMDEEEDQK